MCFVFFPIYNHIVIGENDRCYFADKNGNPINNESYHFISAPIYTLEPNYSGFLSFLNCAPCGSEDFSSSVMTSYIDDQRTVASILDSLTDVGIGKLKMGQDAFEIMELLGIKELAIGKDFNLGNIFQGINWLDANCRVTLLPSDEKLGLIKVIFNSFMLPIENSSERMVKAITLYLDGLGLDKIEGISWDIYITSQRTYDIIHMKDEGVYLVSKPLMNNILNSLIEKGR